MKQEYEVEVAENAGDQRIPLTTTLTSNGTLMMLHISLYPCIITLHLLLLIISVQISVQTGYCKINIAIESIKPHDYKEI